MVVGKDYGLANALSTLHFQAVLHQVLQHMVDGVEVENVLEYLVAANVTLGTILSTAIDSLARLLIFPHLLKLLLFLGAEVFILDAVFQDERATLEATIVHKVTLCHGILQLIGIIWLSLFHLECLVGVFIHLVTWCRCQAHE